MKKPPSSDSFLMIHHGLIQATGSLLTAALLALLREHRAKLIYVGVLPDDGWFFISQPKLTQHLLVKRVDTIKTHTDKLEELGLVATNYAGMPRRIFYRLNDDRYEAFQRSGVALLAGTDTHIFTDEQTPARPETSTRLKRMVNKSNNKSVVVSSKQYPFAGQKDRPQRISIDPHETQKAVAHKKSLTKIPSTVQPIIDKWNEVAREHAQGTKALREGVAAIKAIRAGTFFEGVQGCEKYAVKFTDRQILRAMDRFGVKRNDLNYLPVSKKYFKQLSLSNFFYSPYTNNGNGLPSIFLQCLELKPKPIADMNPELTTVVIKRFELHLGENIVEDQAAHAATRFKKYWNEREKFLKKLGVLNDKNLIVRWSSWLASTRASWGIQHLCAPGMVLDFEKYLHKTQT